MKKILMVGPSYKTKGGISSVINAYKKSSLWHEYNIIWIESYHDKNFYTKISYFINSLFVYIMNLSSSQLVHIHLSEPTSAFRKFFYFFLAKIIGKAVVIHLHSFDINTSVNSKYSFLYKYIFENSDRVIVLSPFWAAEVKRCIPKSNIEIIYNPALIKRKNEFKKEKKILFAGTLNKRKGYDILLKAFALISKKYKDWKLVFAGNGEINQARKLAKDLLIFDQVEFTGWITGNKKNEIFSKSTIFCLPSNAEGFPMSILEALSYSLPVLSTKCGGIELVLTNEKNILFFEMGDFKQLSIELEKLITDNKFRNMLRKNGNLFSRKNFELEKVVDKIKIIYKEI